jgi:hypothetical protein
VRERGGARAGGEDELLERREVGVEGFGVRLEPRHLRVGHDGMAGNRHLAAEIEEIVLHVDEHGAHRRGHVFGEQHAEHRIELVHLAQRGDAGAVLRDARAVGEAGLARVAGARRDLREAMAHGRQNIARGSARSADRMRGRPGVHPKPATARKNSGEVRDGA